MAITRHVTTTPDAPSSSVAHLAPFRTGALGRLSFPPLNLWKLLLHQNRETAAERLADATIASVRSTFTAYDHHPSPPQWEALGAIAGTLARMAMGTCPALPHLSSLDPGVGKTQVVIHFLRTLLASPDYRDAGVLICLPRREQIDSIVIEAGLDENDYAVFTSDDTMNALGRGRGKHQQARVLFSTHAMLESRAARARSFAAIRDFHFRGKPRAVRVWDEALVPGKPITLSRWSISLLFHYLKRDHPALVSDLEELVDQLSNEKDGNRIEFPNLAERHRVDFDQIRAVLRGKADAQTIAEALWALFGRVVTVRQDGGLELGEAGTLKRGNTILDYRETLPGDLWPALILDASGRVRTVYRLWETERGGLVRLPEGPKSYKGHTVHVWETSGSKTAWKKNASQLVEGIATTILERIEEEWLVIVHKGDTIRHLDVAEEVQRLLPPNARVSFTTCGKHDATNEYAHIPNVILAGTLFFPASMLEALGRCAAGLPSSAGAFEKGRIAAVEIGEHHHRILQALCRGRVRKCEDGRCPRDTHTYIIAAAKNGIAQTLGKVLPGTTIVPWRPYPKKALRGRRAEAFEIITGISGDRIAALEVMKIMEWSPTKDGKSDFKERIRDNPEFQRALAEAGFEEMRQGRGGQVWFTRVEPMAA
jgi:hypothetical protein